jgi:F-type H+-transporting ATPase subunit b
VFPDVTVFWAAFLVLLTGLVLNGLIVKPLLRVMSQREGAVKSARDLAESAAAQARSAAAEFDARVQAARGEIYREMDEKRRRALARRADLLAETRTKVEAEISEARKSLEKQAAAARARLEQDANVLAGEIVERVLGRKAS